MEFLQNLARFAKLLAAINKEGLDTKLIEIGIDLMECVNDDDRIQLENDLYDLKLSLKNFKDGCQTSIKKENEYTDRKKVRWLIDGCYDLIHAGHYNAFRQAKKLGDSLVAGVNSDEEIKLVKGPTVFNCAERWEIVRACKWVDEVIQDTDYTPTIEVLDRFDCDFYVHGDDIALNADGVDTATEFRNAGRFKMFKRTRGVSTTDIVSKLLVISEKSTNPLPTIEEEKYESKDTKNVKSNTSIDGLGSYHANPNFLASAKRIAHFANTKEPTESDKIVYIDGSFDICHPGHIEILRKAKELGDFLIVGIHEDQCVNQYLGDNYPLNTLHERVLNILACKYVDDVIIGAPFKITNRLLRDLNVSVVVKSLDVIKNTLRPEALEINPYEVAEKQGILCEVSVECGITLKEIADRVAANKEAIEKKVAKSSKKQNDFEETAKFICEVK